MGNQTSRAGKILSVTAKHQHMRKFVWFVQQCINCRQSTQTGTETSLGPVGSYSHCFEMFTVLVIIGCVVNTQVNKDLGNMLFIYFEQNNFVKIQSNVNQIICFPGLTTRHMNVTSDSASLSQAQRRLTPKKTLLAGYLSPTWRHWRAAAALAVHFRGPTGCSPCVAFGN